MSKEFDEEIKRIQEEKEGLEHKIENIELERAKEIEKCFLGKNYEELMKANLFLDVTGRIHPDFRDYIKQKENLQDDVIKKRFKRDIEIEHYKNAILGKIEHKSYDSKNPINGFSLYFEKEQVVSLPDRKWEQIKEAFFLIKKHIKNYLLRYEQEGLNDLVKKFEKLSGKKEET